MKEKLPVGKVPVLHSDGEACSSDFGDLQSTVVSQLFRYQFSIKDVSQLLAVGLDAPKRRKLGFCHTRTVLAPFCFLLFLLC